MRVVRHQATDRTDTPGAADAASQELSGRLRSLHDHCLTDLAGAPEAMRTGDLTITVTSVTKPIDVAGVPEGQRELVELFNSMLAKRKPRPSVKTAPAHSSPRRSAITRASTICRCVDRAANTTEQVSAVAEETSAATEQVSASAQESSASTTQISSSSAELSEMAAQLAELVAAFTV